MSREVIVVAGMASKACRLLPLNCLGVALAEDSSRLHFIDGGHIDSSGSLVASSPSVQLEAIVETIDRVQADSYLIVAQSLGSVAALDALEKRPSTPIHVLALAPPVPSPRHILDHTRMRERMSLRGGEAHIASWSFAPHTPGTPDNTADAVDIKIDPTYFDEIEGVFSFAERAKLASDIGTLHLVVPLLDWNAESIPFVNDWDNVIPVHAPHSLYSDLQTASVCDYIVNEYLHLTTRTSPILEHH